MKRNILAFHALIFLIASQSIFAMVRPPQPPKLSQKSKASWNSLPAEVKRYALQFIASSNVYEVAETMKALNATDRFCRESIQSDQVIYSILAPMPYYDNQYTLLERLRRWRPIWNIRLTCLYMYRKQDLLVDGEELYTAVRQNNKEQVLQLLGKKNIKLNWYREVNHSPLIAAFNNDNLEIMKILLDVGVNPDADPNPCLHAAVLLDKKEIARLLLAAGANPNVGPFPDDVVSNGSQTYRLVLQAQEKRKKRKQLLCGKKDDGCVIS